MVITSAYTSLATIRAMKPWHKFATVCALSVLVVGCFAILAIAQTNEPKKFYKSYKLLPHQEVIVGNKEFRDVYIHADLPVSVKVGGCSSENTVDLHCYGDPHNVVVVDQRKPGGSERNGVEITFVED